METYLYRNCQMERDLSNKIDVAANELHGGNIPENIQARIDVEKNHIFGNGHGTPLAIAASLADYSAAHGYHVGICGALGNLYISHLLDIAVLDPLKLGLHWEGCLGLDGTRMPEIALNVAPEMLNALRAYLRKLLPDCDVLFGTGVPRGKTVIVPRASGTYNPDNEYLAITLCPYELMSRAGEVWHRAAGVDISDEDLIVSAYRTDVYDIPVLGDWYDFLDLANMLEPKTFSDLGKVIGLCRAWKVQFQAYRIPLLSDRFDHLVGTQEDIYDMCVRLGTSEDDAFRIMWQAVRSELAQEYKDMLAALDAPGLFTATLDNAYQLNPRGQLADEVYWALMILARC